MAISYDCYPHSSLYLCLYYSSLTGYKYIHESALFFAKNDNSIHPKLLPMSRKFCDMKTDTLCNVHLTSAKTFRKIFAHSGAKKKGEHINFVRVSFTEMLDFPTKKVWLTFHLSGLSSEPKGTLSIRSRKRRKFLYQKTLKLNIYKYKSQFLLLCLQATFTLPDIIPS